MPVIPSSAFRWCVTNRQKNRRMNRSHNSQNDVGTVIQSGQFVRRWRPSCFHRRSVRPVHGAIDSNVTQRQTEIALSFPDDPRAKFDHCYLHGMCSNGKFRLMATFGPHRYQFEIGKRDYSFSASVDAWVKESEERLLAVARQSVQDVIDEAQTPTGKGGKMRVDTGFLRASGRLSLNGMPSGPVRGDKDSQHDWNPTIATAEIGKLQLGMSAFFGWTAEYAIYREAYDGFLYGAIQNWQKIVDKNVAALKGRVGK